MVAMERRFALIFWLTMIGALPLAAAYFLSLPAALVVAGAVLFVAGVLAMGATAAADARASGGTITRSLLSGVKAAFGWLLYMLP
jgi:hypothetical protein